MKIKNSICLFCRSHFETYKMNQVHCSVLCRIMCLIEKNKNGCWEWLGGKDKDGYGLTSVGNRSRRVHRIMWEIKNKKEIPPDQNACHSCDNPSCVNPDHIFLGKSYENTQDMMKKGRSRFNKKNKVLTPEEVIKIKKLLEMNFLYSQIARMFEVSPSTIEQIDKNKTWKHVD